MAELEDIQERKHYRMPIDWNCPSCDKRCMIKGKLIREDIDPKEKLSWEEIIQKFCVRCNIITRPGRQCSFCDSVYDFDSSGCRICDSQISRMIDLEDEYNRLTDEVKRSKRKRQPTQTMEDILSTIVSQLAGLGGKVCDVCNKYWLITLKNFTCDKCLSKICG